MGVVQSQEGGGGDKGTGRDFVVPEVLDPARVREYFAGRRGPFRWTWLPRGPEIGWLAVMTHGVCAQGALWALRAIGLGPVSDPVRGGPGFT